MDIDPNPGRGCNGGGFTLGEDEGEGGGRLLSCMDKLSDNDDDGSESFFFSALLRNGFSKRQCMLSAGEVWIRSLLVCNERLDRLGRSNSKVTCYKKSMRFIIFRLFATSTFVI